MKESAMDELLCELIGEINGEALLTGVAQR
jgi:hypothetical protein